VRYQAIERHREEYPITVLYETLEVDLTRAVEPEVIRECLSLAVQAPTPGSMQNWHFLVVTDPSKREALASLYRKSASAPGGQEDMLKQVIASATSEKEATDLIRKVAPARYLTEHIHEVPVYVIPCIEGRAEHLVVSLKMCPFFPE